MNKKLLASLAGLAVATSLCIGTAARAAVVVDTGVPNGKLLFATLLDANDWTAARVSFASESDVDSVLFHILGGSAGETFHISLYENSAAGLPGGALYNTVATFGTDGWNGASGLSAWDVAAGSYWFGVEVWDGDTLGSNSITGAGLDQGAANVLQNTALNASFGTDYTLVGAQSIGLQVNASAVSSVPEAPTVQTLAAGLAMLAGAAYVRRRRQG